MGRFRFRLATLLKLRESARDELRGQLAEAFRAEEILGRRLDELEREAREVKLCQAALPGRINVDRMIDAQRFGLILETERQAIQSRRVLLTEEIHRRRDALAAADRELRVVEKLRDVQAERFRAAEERSESKFLDETALQGWAREKSE